MKTYLLTIMLGLMALLKPESVQKNNLLLETKHFEFYSNPILNEHLFLYNQALRCKFGKIHPDSISDFILKDKKQQWAKEDWLMLEATVKYYTDSLLGKDLLFNPEMSAFSDLLTEDDPYKKISGIAWYKPALQKIQEFHPIYLKHSWAATAAQNKTWLNEHTKEITEMETSVLTKLQSIFQQQLPSEKIRVELSSYASWAGAYSYKNAYPHVIFSAVHKSNQQEAGIEVLFHEATHFLVDKLSETIAKATEGKTIKKDLNLWHNLIFYTTGHVVQQTYSNIGKKTTPYYIQQDFETKFPDFKLTVDAARLYWEPYLMGHSKMDEAVEKMIELLNR